MRAFGQKHAVALTDKLTLSPSEACALAGVGAYTLYKAIHAGALVARKQGKRTLIRRADLDAWIAAWPRLGDGKAD